MRRILFVELLGGIGDLVIALPAIQALGRSHPGAELTVLTFAPGSELLRHDPLVQRVLVAPRGGARACVEDLLAREAFDLIVSDTNYEGIGELLEQSGAARVVSNLWRSPPLDQRVGDRFLRILLEEGVIRPNVVDDPYIRLTEAERDGAQEAFGQCARPLVVLLPDAGMPIKRWPEDRFVQLGRELRHHHRATLLVAEGDDRAEAERIAAEIGEGADVLPRLGLRHFAAAVEQADLAVGSDTGPLRIAATMRVPTVALFGPSWHGRYGHPPPHLNLQAYPECPERIPANFTEQCCWYGGACPLGRWSTCLEEIRPEEVLAAAESLL